MTPHAASGGPVIPNFGHASDCIRNNGTFCTEWVHEHWRDTLQPALIQHIEITLIAMAVGFVIAMALALIAHRRQHLDHPIGLLATLIYTIPSVALFELLVPFTGTHVITTIEIALVGYTLVILYPSIMAGLRSAPPEVLEAARGMGLTRRQVLVQVELPMAVPAIIGGLRVAVVSTISIATLAATISTKGLGWPILYAMHEPHPFKTEIYAAAALTIGLALVCDLGLAALRRTLAPWRVA